MMDQTLYDRDIIAWAEEQAAALRMVAERRPDLSNLLDWHNLAEEMDSLSRTEVNSFVGPLRQALIHLVTLASAPHALSADAWRAEALNFQVQARDAFAPSMRQRIDLDLIWRDAVDVAKLSLKAHGDALAPNLGTACPLALAQLVTVRFDIQAAVDAIAARTAEAGRA